MSLLGSDELGRLERLTVATRTRQLGTFTGDHRSKRFGSSLDFAEHREYRPGDDFRTIDAALSARMDRLFVRLYEAEEDVSVRIVLDLSASMTFGEPPKEHLARRLAAAFLHVASLQNDRARIYTAGAEPMMSRWFRGRTAVHEAMPWIEGAPAGGRGDVRAVLRAIREEGRPGVLVLLSDMLDDTWEDTVRRLAPPGEAAVVHILAPDELHPQLEGDLTLVDAETGDEVTIAADAATITAYERRVQAFTDDVRSRCAARGIPYAHAASDADLLDLFLRAFRREAVLR